MSVPSSLRICSRKRFFSLSAIWPMRCLETPKRCAQRAQRHGIFGGGQVLVPDGALALVGQVGGEPPHQIGHRARQLAARGLRLGEAPPPGSRSSSAQALLVGRGSSDTSREARCADTSSTSFTSTSSLAASSLGVGSNPAASSFCRSLLEAEEQLAAGARVAHVDEARVGHQETQDVGPDPVGGVRAEAGAQGRIPALDRLHRAQRAPAGPPSAWDTRASIVLMAGERRETSSAATWARGRTTGALPRRSGAPPAGRTAGSSGRHAPCRR